MDSEDFIPTENGSITNNAAHSNMADGLDYGMWQAENVQVSEGFMNQAAAMQQLTPDLTQFQQSVGARLQTSANFNMESNSKSERSVKRTARKSIKKRTARKSLRRLPDPLEVSTEELNGHGDEDPHESEDNLGTRSSFQPRSFDLHGFNLGCMECGERFSNVREYGEHVRSHELEKEVTCDQCSRKFWNEEELIEHSKNHIVKLGHVCELCGYATPRLADILLHLKMHTGTKDIMCAHCDMGFSHTKYLRRHLTRFHKMRLERGHDITEHISERAPSAEPEVDVTADQKTNINIKGKPLDWNGAFETTLQRIGDHYLCPMCSHITTKAYDMRMHLVSHTNIKPYACIACDSRFSHPKYLRRHVKRLHSHMDVDKLNINQMSHFVGTETRPSTSAAGTGLPTPDSGDDDVEPLQSEGLPPEALPQDPLASLAGEEAKEEMEQTMSALQDLCDTVKKEVQAEETQENSISVLDEASGTIIKLDTSASPHTEHDRQDTSDLPNTGHAGLDTSDPQTEHVKPSADDQHLPIDTQTKTTVVEQGSPKMEESDDEPSKDYDLPEIDHSSSEEELSAKTRGRTRGLRGRQRGRRRKASLPRRVSKKMLIKDEPSSGNEDAEQTEDTPIKNKTVVKLYRCRQCSYTTNREYDLKVHRLTHSKNKEAYTCSECGAEFAHPKYLKRHLRRGHKHERLNYAPRTIAEGEEKPDLMCDECGAVFTQPEFLERHKARGHAQKSFKCPHCTARFARNNSLQEHIRTHTGERPFVCYECGARFVRSSTLREHTLSVHARVGDVTCGLCGETLPSDRALRRHVDEIHAKEAQSDGQRHMCTTCNKSMPSAAALEKHRVLHGTGSSWRCIHCAAKFSERKELQQHVYEEHRKKAGQRERICEVCGQKLSSSYYLKLHMLIHEDDMPHHCTHCPAKFRSPYMLKAHLKRHTNQQEYTCKCSICGMGFKNGIATTQHMKRIHGPHTVVDKRKRRSEPKVTLPAPVTAASSQPSVESGSFVTTSQVLATSVGSGGTTPMIPTGLASAPQQATDQPEPILRAVMAHMGITNEPMYASLVPPYIAQPTAQPPYYQPPQQ